MADLDFATVIGRFGLGISDTPIDPDADPDTIWCDGGTVVISPLVTEVKVAVGTPVPFTLSLDTYTCTISSTGYLTYGGLQSVEVVDLTSTKVNPTIATGATHRVDFFNVTAGTRPVTFDSFSCRIVPGTNDLTLIAPVAFDGTTAITIGPAGLTWRGTWAAATAYVVNDAVYYNGSSYRRLVAGTTATAPDSDATNWTLLAQRGTDGTGTGNVSGPASSADTNLTAFSGTTGKLIADSGIAVAAVATLAGTQTLTNKTLGSATNSVDGAAIKTGTVAYARHPVGTAASTLAAGDDSRITGAAQKASNLSDLASATTARTNLGLGTAATSASTDFASSTGGAREKVAALSATTGTATGDLSTASWFTITPTGAFTIAFSNVPASGTACTVTVEISQGGTAYAATYPTGTIWLGSTPTQTASKKCLVTLATRDGGTTWIASGAVQA